jgi:hypothetical protein
VGGRDAAYWFLLQKKEGDPMDKVKGVTPKGEAISAPKYVATAKSFGSEPHVQNVVAETSALQKESHCCEPYRGMVSPLKISK